MALAQLAAVHTSPRSPKIQWMVHGFREVSSTGLVEGQSACTKGSFAFDLEE